MSNPIIFDTHLFIKRLTEAGFDSRQAEALCDTLKTSFGDAIATKNDIARLENTIEVAKRDVKLWVLTGNGLVGALIALLKLFGG